MCGVAGVIRRGAAPSRIERELERMRPGIAPRGPDGSGKLVFHDVGFLHTRLAVIDLVTGDQPVWNEARTVACILNGEIYDFQRHRAALSRSGHVFSTTSDTEVLVHLYEEHGADFVEHVHGMFALAVWDSVRRRVVIARDRLGMKPLYLADVPAGFAFASAIQSLAALDDVSRDVDATSLAEYLRRYKVPEPRTMCQAIRCLPPGHVLVSDLETGSRHTKCYARLPASTATSSPDVVQNARLAFESAVKSHLVADVEVGAFLSGGIDSTLVVAEAQRHAARPIRTFSVSFTGYRGFDESNHAESVAKALGTRHETFEVTSAPSDLLRVALRAAGQPFAVASFLPLLQLSERAAREVKVVLTGDGGDEVGGGYPWYRWMSLVHDHMTLNSSTAHRLLRRAELGASALRLRQLRRAAKFLRGVVLPPGEASEAWRYELTAGDAESLLCAELRRSVERAGTSEWDLDGGPVEAMRRHDMQVLLRDEMLPKLDRAGMAFGLEGRVPLLDDAFVDAMLAISMRTHLAHSHGKAVLRRWASELCPDLDVRRAKHGFDVPVAAWLTGALADEVKSLLSSPKNAALFDRGATRAIVSRMHRGVPGAAHVVYAMVLAAIWTR